MLNLVNRDADRLAQLLDTAEHLLGDLASSHAAKADAMAYLRDNRLRDYHRLAQERARAVAAQCADASKHARARKPWTPTRADQHSLTLALRHAN